MTVTVSVSLPDDVGAILATKDNPSDYVAEALRRQYAKDQMDAALIAANIHVTEEGKARARAKLARARASAAGMHRFVFKELGLKDADFDRVTQ